MYRELNKSVCVSGYKVCGLFICKHCLLTSSSRKSGGFENSRPDLRVESAARLLFRSKYAQLKQSMITGTGLSTVDHRSLL